MLLLLAIALAVGQFVPAFLTLDLLFRYMDVRPGALRIRLRRYGWLYAGCAVIWSVAGAWLQWLLGGTPGLAIAVFNLVPWWVLWHFGLRKQLTYLFRDDGGRPANTKNPDP